MAAANEETNEEEQKQKTCWILRTKASRCFTLHLHTLAFFSRSKQQQRKDSGDLWEQWSGALYQHPADHVRPLHHQQP
jgi:hypothetical protein